MPKQSSIEWLIEQMLKQGYFEADKPFTFTNLDHLQHEAKKMHKEEIIDAFVECWKANMPDGFDCKLSANEYYQETYGGNIEKL